MLNFYRNHFCFCSVSIYKMFLAVTIIGAYCGAVTFLLVI